MRVDLFVIDGQNDFCAAGTEPDDFPWPMGGKRQGSLYVQDADKEAVLVADMLDRLADPAVQGGHKINKIHATLDSHHKKDGAHHTVWKNGQTGQVADPFTIVSHQDVLDQKFVPTFALGVFDGQVMTALDWAKKYTKALEENGRNPLCLWPPHCEIGKWGSQVYQPLADAYDRWCDSTNSWIDFITKGAWAWSEHYSAMKADVPDPSRSETQMNAGVVNDAMSADIIVWAGWAGSHCTRWTAKDAVENFDPRDDKGNVVPDPDNAFVKKSVFLEDACAPVVSPDPAATKMFAEWREEFLNDMSKRGATISNTKKFLS
jgi:nicotinamidase-related amidase